MNTIRYDLPQQMKAPPNPTAFPPSSRSIPSSYVPMTDTLPPRDIFESVACTYSTFPSSATVDIPVSPTSPTSRSPSTSTQSQREASLNSPLQRKSPRRLEMQAKLEPYDSSVFMQQECSKVKQDGEEDIAQVVPCDFVRKLYTLLEDKRLSDTICWGPQGDFFIIKDVTKFTIDVLPRTFKHSNFASFVRQLNKYDFHKIKATDDTYFGENSWLFRHRDFHAGGLELLENIKRKIPGSRKASQPKSPVVQTASPSALQSLQEQVQRMAQQQDEMTAQIQTIENECVSVLGGMISLQRDFAQQDGTMRELVQYALQYEHGGAAL